MKRKTTTPCQWNKTKRFSDNPLQLRDTPWSKIQAHIAAISGEHIKHIHLSYEMLPQTEGNPQKAAKGQIHQHSQIIAWPDILIAFLKDYV